MSLKKDVARVFVDLGKQDLFICNESKNKMCLKNSNGEVVFSFELKKDTETLVSLKCAVDDLKLKIDRAFIKNWI